MATASTGPNSGTSPTRNRRLHRKHATQEHKILKESFPQPAPVNEADAIIQPFLSAKEILKVACSFESARLASSGGALQPAPLPELEDLESYGIQNETQKKLWRIEIARLSAVARRGDEALIFDEEGLFDGLSDEQGFAALHYLARSIHEAFFVCIHDFGLFVLEYASEATSSVTESFLKGHRILVMRDRRWNDSSRSDAAPEWFKDKENEGYYLLVNYLTAALAKFLVRCAVGQNWTQECIALLAKWSTKLKIVAQNPRSSIRTSINKARRLREQKQLELEEEIISEGFATVFVESANSKKRSELVTALDDAMKVGKGDRETNLAILKAEVFYEYFSSMMLCMLNDLQAGTIGKACFQLGRRVYPSGIDDWRILLTSDRDSIISASSSQASLRFAHVALMIFCRTASHLKKNQRLANPQTTTKATGHEVEISWKFESPAACSTHKEPTRGPATITGPVKADSGQIKVNTMGEVVRLLVPLSLIDAYVLAQVVMLIDIIGLIEDMHPPEPFANVNFTGMAHMTTDEYNRRFPTEFDRDVHRIPTIPFGLSTESGVAGTALPRGNALATVMSQHSHDIDFHESVQEFHKAEKRMKDWTYDEKSIAVPCKLYVTSVVSTAIILVGGGLGVGFSVHTRITGVDPFNITLFFWILAGFILAVAQSLRVENWPWRDFIFCRVVCRSVSELHAVTGVNDQLILRKLLDAERTNILQTRGPFNEPFVRKSESLDGFSIDRPLTLKTMVLSGLVIVKVKTAEGFALVCLDVRRDTIIDGVKFNELGTDSDRERLVCVNLSPEARGRYGEFKLTRKKLGWLKTVGLYAVMDSKFG